MRLAGQLPVGQVAEPDLSGHYLSDIPETTGVEHP